MNEADALTLARERFGRTAYIRRTLYASSNDAFYEVGVEKPEGGGDDPLGLGSTWDAAFKDAEELKRYDARRRKRMNLGLKP